MALALDGYFVLKRIGKNPKAFAGVKSDATKAAISLVSKQLKTADLETLRGVRKALNEESFALVVDSFSDAQTKSLASKFDKHNTALKSVNADARRRHLLALATGAMEPAEKAARAKKISAPERKTAKGGKKLNRLFSESMSAKRDSE